MKTHDNTILITGGGSGIGRAFARRLAADGNRVIVAGRNPATLAETIGDRADMTALPLDVTDRDDVARFAANVTRRFPALNILVNCAGIMRFETLAAARDLADAEETIATNLLGPIRLTDALTDHLTGIADAAIVNVTSGLAFVPLAATPTYSATKAALHSYTVALRTQLRGKVEVIEIAPPAVQTDLTPGQSTREGYQPLDDFADEALALLRAQPTPAEVLAEGVKPFRHAERDGTFDAFVAKLAGG